MRILYHAWNALGDFETKEYLKTAGHRVTEYLYQFASAEQKENDPAYYDNLSKKIASAPFDCLFSWNYFPIDAQVCHEHDIPYIAWVYDCPLNVNHLGQTLGYETNYVFFFDQNQALDVQQANRENPQAVANVYYLPLATDVTRKSHFYLTAADHAKYDADISFVGQLYPSAAEYILGALPDYEKGYLEAAMKTQSNLYGQFFIPDLYPPKRCEEIFALLKKAGLQLNGELQPSSLYYAIASGITSKERLVLLALLSNHYQVKLYSKDHHSALQKVEYMGYVNNIQEAPKVFLASRINLNVSLRCISSGIPLRVLDILSCGGTVLSNYQPDLAEYFALDEEVVCYGSMEEAKEKADYLLAHEEDRRKIGENGYKKVRECFSYEVQFRKIFDTVSLH